MPGPLPSSPRDEPRDGRGRAAAGSTLRLILLVAGAGAAASLLGHQAWSALPRSAGGGLAVTTTAMSTMPIDRTIGGLLLGCGALAGTWIALSALLALVLVLTSGAGRRWRAGERVLEALAPAMVRRLARTAAGVGVGAGLVLAPTSAALAADQPSPAPTSVTVQATDAAPIDLGWRSTASTAAPQPDRTTDSLEEGLPEVGSHAGTATPPAHDADERDADEPDAQARIAEASTTTSAAKPLPVAQTLRAVDEAPGTVVVLRGDTLWDIAVHALGGAPSDAEVLREVTRWHAANRDVIGHDPDVILPGQVLRAPG